MQLSRSAGGLPDSHSPVLSVRSFRVTDPPPRVEGQQSPMLLINIQVDAAARSTSIWRSIQSRTRSTGAQTVPAT